MEVEKSWGDYLMSSKNYEDAVEHYIQSGHNKQAMEAALSSKNLEKAAELLDQLVGFSVISGIDFCLIRMTQ